MAEKLKCYYIIGYRVEQDGDEENEERIRDTVEAANEGDARDEFHSKYGYDVDITCVHETV